MNLYYLTYIPGYLLLPTYLPTYLTYLLLLLTILSYTYSKKAIAKAFLASLLLGYLLHTYRSYVRTALKKGLTWQIPSIPSHRPLINSTLPPMFFPKPTYPKSTLPDR